MEYVDGVYFIGVVWIGGVEFVGDIECFVEIFVIDDVEVE